jgi:hypothetical protein
MPKTLHVRSRWCDPPRLQPLLRVAIKIAAVNALSTVSIVSTVSTVNTVKTRYCDPRRAGTRASLSDLAGAAVGLRCYHTLLSYTCHPSV